MAWTTPRTWTSGETVTASIMNTHVRDNLAYLKDDVVQTTILKMSGNYSFSATSNWEVLSWDTEVLDEGGWHDNVTNNERITVPTAGLYIITIRTQWGATASTGRRLMRLAVNGNQDSWVEHGPNSSSQLTMSGTWHRPLAANDFLRADVYTTTAADSVTSGMTFFEVTRLRVD